MHLLAAEVCFLYFIIKTPNICEDILRLTLFSKTVIPTFFSVKLQAPFPNMQEKKRYIYYFFFSAGTTESVKSWTTAYICLSTAFMVSSILAPNSTEMHSFE